MEDTKVIRVSDFWGPNFFAHQPLSDEIVALAEQQLGARLPVEYLELLWHQNGGYIRNVVLFPLGFQSKLGVSEMELDALFGIVIDPANKSPLNILRSPYLSAEWGLCDHQVLIAGDGHWWLSLDYLVDGIEPRIRWHCPQFGESVIVATSFKEFISGLRLGEADQPPN